MRGVITDDIILKTKENNPNKKLNPKLYYFKILLRCDTTFT